MAGTITWFVIAAGVAALWVPWRITGWDIRYESTVGHVAHVVGLALS